jgi:hypothetical protein
MFTFEAVYNALQVLIMTGSSAAEGFNNPEGIIVYHVAGNLMFKKTIKDDESPKGL